MNVITPLMVYLPLIIIVAQRYQRDAGIGTIMSLMIPYTLVVAVIVDHPVHHLVPARHSARPRLPGRDLARRAVAPAHPHLRRRVHGQRRNGFESHTHHSVSRAAVASSVALGAAPIGHASASPSARPAPCRPRVGLSRASLAESGFEGKVGQTLAVPRPDGEAVIAVGIGAARELDAATLRDAAAAFGRAAGKHARLATTLADVSRREARRRRAGRRRGHPARALQLRQPSRRQAKARRRSRSSRSSCRGAKAAAARRGAERGKVTADGRAALPRSLERAARLPHGDAHGRGRDARRQARAA